MHARRSNSEDGAMKTAPFMSFKVVVLEESDSHGGVGETSKSLAIVQLLLSSLTRSDIQVTLWHII